MNVLVEEDVREAVKDGHARFAAALRNGDTVALAGLYTVDGQVLAPDLEPVRGPAIREYWTSLLGTGVQDVRLESVELDVHGDTAIELGEFALLGVAGALMENGKYLVVWKHDRGVWRMHRDIWNSSLRRA